VSAGRPSPAVARATRSIFAGVARLRGDRAFHPDGTTFRATLRPLGGGTAVALLHGERAALVRISRGLGLPERLPDVLGCAIRVPDAYGPGAHQDFALASSHRARVARHALVPAQSYERAFYSSILPYRLGDETVIVGASIRAGAVELCVAPPRGEWRRIAAVALEGAAPEAEARELRFNVLNSGGGIRPLGRLNSLRDPAYRGSQAASPGAA
jgi:hypothetical protein